VVGSNASVYENPAAVSIVDIGKEHAATTQPQIKAEHINVTTTSVAITQEEAIHDDKKMTAVTKPIVTEDEHWGAMMDLETDDDQTISPDCED